MEASLEQELLVERGRRDAWFRAASGGTLVVDGIDRLPARTQSELRRVLDEPATRARRGPSWEPLGVRVLSLSREALTGKVASGEFLDALHYRVSASHLHVPTLQERAEDLSLVAELLRELTPPSTTPPRITPGAWDAISRHEFKGNVRELRWTLERALVQSSGDGFTRRTCRRRCFRSAPSPTARVGRPRGDEASRLSAVRDRAAAG